MKYLNYFQDNLIDLLVILAGGRGTRLYPVSSVITKGMLRLKESSLILKTILRAHMYGANKILIITNNNDDLIVDLLKQNTSNDIKITVKTLENTSIMDKIKEIVKHNSRRICLCYGDTYANVNYKKLIDTHILLKKTITITLMPHKISFGHVSIDSNNCVTSFNEKPETKYLVNIGHFIFNVDDNFKKTVNDSKTFIDFLNQNAVNENISAYVHNGVHETLNDYSDLIKLS